MPDHDDYWVPADQRLDTDEGEGSVANRTPPPEETDFSDLRDDPGEVVEEDLG